MGRIPTISLVVLLGGMSALVLSGTTRAWAWGTEGHQIVAIIAADNLTPNARTHVAKILRVSAKKKAVATAMAAAAIRPDTQFRNSNPETKPWHFIDLCLQDTQSDLPARCPNQECVVAKIDEYTARLRDGHADHFGAKGDVAFLLHFVGDIHQPLHTATNADRGGNCVQVAASPASENLHHTWDTVLVQQVENAVDAGTVQATARKLETKYGPEKATFAWQPDGTAAVAWESTGIARKEIYTALPLPEQSCEPNLASCQNVHAGTVTLSADERKRESDI